jgi:SAM-dependent methyltransferase
MSNKTKEKDAADIRSAVRDRYGAIAESAGESCCGPSGCGCGDGASDAEALIQVERLYQDPDVADLPEEVTGLSLGCGDPVTLASLKPGQTVLDLGSGGGIDCFLAAKKVGPTGKVIGVDMTPAMLEQARANKAKIGAENVEFRLGEIEHLPVPDSSVDVIISNCVINLSTDKPQVFREAFRALRPGGRLAVSDIVTDGPLPDEIKRDLSAWAGCVAGALDAKDYIAAIEAAGLVEIELKPEYMDEAIIAEAVEKMDLGAEIDPKDIQVQKSIFSAKVTAFKPGW